MAKKPIRSETKKRIKRAKINVVSHKYDPKRKNSNITLQVLSCDKNGVFDAAEKTGFKSAIINLGKNLTPAIQIDLNGLKDVYDKRSTLIRNVKITATTSIGYKKFSKIRFYVNNSMVTEFTDGVADGGTFTYNHAFPSSINDDITVKVTVIDTGNKSFSEEKKVLFMNPSYIGFIDNDMTAITSDDISTLTSFISAEKEKKYQFIGSCYGRLVYAYPKKLGNITHLMDLDSEIIYNENTLVFKELQILGEIYCVCHFRNPVEMTDVNFLFE
ncbi:MAG: hypothetical protein MJZ37_00725 [Bacilli bacterium]|nr:hypothetical protein [Bacilli bacterium]